MHFMELSIKELQYICLCVLDKECKDIKNSKEISIKVPSEAIIGCPSLESLGTQQERQCC